MGAVRPAICQCSVPVHPFTLTIFLDSQKVLRCAGETFEKLPSLYMCVFGFDVALRGRICGGAGGGQPSSFMLSCLVSFFQGPELTRQREERAAGAMQEPKALGFLITTNLSTSENIPPNPAESSELQSH